MILDEIRHLRRAFRHQNVEPPTMLILPAARADEFVQALLESQVYAHRMVALERYMGLAIRLGVGSSIEVR